MIEVFCWTVKKFVIHTEKVELFSVLQFQSVLSEVLPRGTQERKPKTFSGTNKKTVEKKWEKFNAGVPLYTFLSYRRNFLLESVNYLTA